MNSLLQNSTAHLPEPLQYRRLAIDYIGRVVKAREYCHRHKVGRIVSETTRQPVREQYKAYKLSWKVGGVAKFILRYQNNLLDMTTCEKQIEELVQLIEESKQYINN